MELRLECVPCARTFDTIEEAYAHELDTLHDKPVTFLIQT